MTWLGAEDGDALPSCVGGDVGAEDGDALLSCVGGDVGAS